MEKGQSVTSIGTYEDLTNLAKEIKAEARKFDERLRSLEVRMEVLIKSVNGTKEESKAEQYKYYY